MTNSRTSMIIGSNGNVGVGDAALTNTDFVIGCKSGACSIQTRALNGTASNTVKAIGSTGIAIVTRPLLLRHANKLIMFQLIKKKRQPFKEWFDITSKALF